MRIHIKLSGLLIAVVGFPVLVAATNFDNEVPDYKDESKPFVSESTLIETKIERTMPVDEKGASFEMLVTPEFDADGRQPESRAIVPERLGVSAVLELDKLVSGINPDNLTWDVSGSEGLMVAFDSGTRIATITAAGGWKGPGSIAFTVTGPGGFNTTQEIPVMTKHMHPKDKLDMMKALEAKSNAAGAKYKIGSQDTESDVKKGESISVEQTDDKIMDIGELKSAMQTDNKIGVSISVEQTDVKKGESSSSRMKHLTGMQIDPKDSTQVLDMDVIKASSSSTRSFETNKRHRNSGTVEIKIYESIDDEKGGS